MHRKAHRPPSATRPRARRASSSPISSPASRRDGPPSRPAWPIAWTAAWVISALLVAAPDCAAQECGDVDDSGSIGPTDALLVLQASTGLATGELHCPFPASGQTVASTADKNGQTSQAVADDGSVQAGTSQIGAFTDNGDGTVTDSRTGLMWEKKSDDGGLHDRDDTYPWSSTSEDTIWDWLDDVNAAEFAGHSDWRIPNVKELQSIVDYGASDPNVNAAFNSGCADGCDGVACSCTSAFLHWSSTTFQAFTTSAWAVGFKYGDVDGRAKSTTMRVRAVRAGNLP